MTAEIRELLETELAAVSGDALVAKLFAFMKERGNAHYDEEVTQLEHALQCAQLARDRGFSNEAVTASLLHDIGHLLVDEHDAQSEFLQQDLNHEQAGASLLATWFPDQVTQPIQLHVVAKRYLCSTDPSYIEQLSTASQRSFELQGGQLTPSQQAKLEQNEHIQLALILRRIDDEGKDPGKRTPGIEEFADIVASCLR